MTSSKSQSHMDGLSSLPVRYPDSCVLQFAKAPLQGRVKTRLQPVLGEVGSLQLHCAMVAYQFRIHRASAVSNLELWCSAEHEFFHQLVEGTGVQLVEQQGCDLGGRMANAFADRLTQFNRVIIIGSDCPAIDGEYITQALEALDDVPAVFGPAKDGGYVLIGLNCLNPALFSDIPWGSGEVMAKTRGRLSSLGWAWKELSVLADIDRPEDLVELSNFDEL